LFEALFTESLRRRAERARDRLAARVRPLRERPRYRARHTVGAEGRKCCWRAGQGPRLREHLHEGEDSEKLAPRAGATSDFVDWIAKRCGGEIETMAGIGVETEKQSVLDVAQTISVIISLASAATTRTSHAVDLARREGPGVAARDAGRRQ